MFYHYLARTYIVPSDAASIVLRYGRGSEPTPFLYTPSCSCQPTTIAATVYWEVGTIVSKGVSLENLLAYKTILTGAPTDIYRIGDPRTISRPTVYITRPPSCRCVSFYKLCWWPRFSNSSPFPESFSTLHCWCSPHVHCCNTHYCSPVYYLRPAAIL